jgi:hypothetical protein
MAVHSQVSHCQGSDQITHAGGPIRHSDPILAYWRIVLTIQWLYHSKKKYANEMTTYSSILNCRLPQIVAYPLFILTYTSISGLFPCIDFHSDYNRYSTYALPTRLNALLENPGIPLLFRIQTVSLKVLDLKFKSPR